MDDTGRMNGQTNDDDPNEYFGDEFDSTEFGATEFEEAGFELAGFGNLAVDFDQHWMQRALELASQAIVADEVPVGAVIVDSNGRMIAAAHNQREQLRDPTAHAEMIAITQAAEAMGDWRLEGCTLYVTLEPCPMCAGAILLGRIPRVVYGATDPKAGACHSLYSLLQDPRLNHRCEVVSGVLAGRSSAMLTEFFRRKRAMGKK